MMGSKNYKSGTGLAVDLGKEIGKGGEGAVFQWTGHPDRVVKVYKKPVSDTQADKLREMVRKKDPELLSFTAWPKEILLQQDGKVRGFIMEHLGHYGILPNLYNPGFRKKIYSDADWSFLVHAARNIAAAFAAIHRHGYVVGDVNEQNILISDDCTVKLIDCDSFQVGLYPCNVFRPHFVPPELQITHEKEGRTKNHDIFGMAVLCFQMLFMGKPPFKGRPPGSGETKIEEAIRNYDFAFGARARKKRIRPPSDAPPLSMLPKELADLFEFAFGEEGVRQGRPEARRWVRAFDRLERELRDCRKNKKHWYHMSQSVCPWCAVEAMTGIRHFPSGTQRFLSGKAAASARSVLPGSPGKRKKVFRPNAALNRLKTKMNAVNNAWRRVSSIPLPAGFPKTPLAGVMPTPLPKGMRAQIIKRWKAVGIIASGCLVVLVLGLSGYWDPWTVFGISTMVSLFFLYLSANRLKDERRKRRVRLGRAKRTMQFRKFQWKIYAGNKGIRRKIRALDARYQRYLNVDKTLRNRYLVGSRSFVTKGLELHRTYLEIRIIRGEKSILKTVRKRRDDWQRAYQALEQAKTDMRAV